MKRKEQKPKSLAATEEEPIKNLLFLLALIPITPFLLIYYFATGKTQNSFILGSGISIILTAISIYGLIMYSESSEIQNVELLSMIEELSVEEHQDLREETSTIRESIGAEKFPQELEPMFDIKQNMLVINYYNYLVNAGQIGNNGEGAIYILQNTLYGKDINAIKAAWKSLHNINTKETKLIMANYASDIEELKKLQKEREHQQQRMHNSGKGGKFDFYINKFKNKINVIKNNF